MGGCEFQIAFTSGDSLSVTVKDWDLIFLKVSAYNLVPVEGKIGKERGFEYYLVFCLPNEMTDTMD